MMNTTAKTIRAQFVEGAIGLLQEHPHWTVEKAVARHGESKGFLRIYYHSLSADEIDGLCNLVKRTLMSQRKVQS